MSYTHWAVGDYAAALDAIRTDNDGFRGVVLAALNRPDEALASLDEPRGGRRGIRRRRRMSSSCGRLS